MRTKTLLSCGVAALTIAAVPATASAAENGPAPTAASVTATTGPYTVLKATAPDSKTVGFGSGTVWYPSPTQSPGVKFGAIAVAPGFTESESAISWYGPRLASQGFVVITFNTNSIIDAPSSRGYALNNAVKYLINSSVAKGEVDPARTAVMGHSMGGGGVLDAEKSNPALKAGIALSPWEQSSANFASITTPTLIVGAQNDVIAPVALHSVPFYNQIPNTVPKAYIEFKGADHFLVTKPNNTVAAASIDWLKYFVDGDTRYASAVCPGFLGASVSTLSVNKNSCDTAAF